MACSSSRCGHDVTRIGKPDSCRRQGGLQPLTVEGWPDSVGAASALGCRKEGCSVRRVARAGGGSSPEVLVPTWHPAGTGGPCSFLCIPA